MSNKKKSFLLHIDSLDILDDLTNGQAGVLFKAIKAYQKNEVFELDSIVKIAFSPFKNQFSRDNVKYDNLCEKNRLIAINRHKNKSTTGTSGDQSLPDVTKSTDNKNKNKTKSDNDNKSVNEVISYLNMVINAKYKTSTKSHIENISARLNDGHSVNDLKLVIDSKSREWLNTDMAQYLRPSTLFQASKFQGYLLHAKPMVSSQSPRGFSQ